MKQTYIPGGRAIAFNLTATDEVPHTGHPMGQQGKCGHEQSKDHSAVLGVTIQLLEKAQETQQAHSLQQVNPKVLEERGVTTHQTNNGSYVHFLRVIYYFCVG